MDEAWVARLRTVADRNRPSRKPQLWENFAMAFRRRIELELGRRLDREWPDRSHVIELSQIGFDGPAPPLRMEVVPREVMNKALFLYGTFEISETRLVQSFLRSGMTMIDVGANIGYYTLIAARMVGPSGVVHCFEPNSEVRLRLERNVRLNELENVFVHDHAMTRQSGHIKFYVSAVPENSGISSIVPGTGLGTEGTSVPCISLDDFVERLPNGRADLLKMDIEGAELDVIEGGRKTLGAANAPALLFESFDVQPLLVALRALGYQIRRLHYTLRDGLELPDAEAPLDSLFAGYESPNYFAVKDPGLFDTLLAAVNTRRSTAFQILGRL
jgi:FkbM family methyltransferase